MKFDNPCSREHYRYQRMCDRLLTLLGWIVWYAFSWAWICPRLGPGFFESPVGSQAAIAGVVGALALVMSLLFIGLVGLLFVRGIPAFFKWLAGY